MFYEAGNARVKRWAGKESVSTFNNAEIPVATAYPKRPNMQAQGRGLN
jgi:hypothetical protein